MDRRAIRLTIAAVLFAASFALAGPACAEEASQLSASDWTTPMVGLEKRYAPSATTTWAPTGAQAPQPGLEKYRAAVSPGAYGSGPIGWARREMAKECLCRKMMAGTPRQFWYRDYFRPSSWQEWLSLGTSAALVAGGAAMFIVDDRDFTSEVSDIGEIALPTLAYLVPVANADSWGLLQYAVQNAVSTGITQGIKEGVQRWRPELDAPDSFPSGHTTAAFSGASFLHTRYGQNWGVPAYLGAILVGATRVNLERHYLSDVIAGAGVSMVSNWLLAIPFGGECRELTRFGCPAKWRIEFAFSVVEQSLNDIQAPSDTGTPLSLNDWNEDDEGYPNARVSFQYFINPRHELMLRIDPFEFQGVRTLTDPISFGGQTFAAGEETFSRWTAHEYKLRWRYEFLPRNRCFDLRAGVTGVVGDYRAEIYNEAASGSVSESGVIAAPHVYGAWEFARDFELSVRAEGIPGVDFAGVDVETVLRWYLRPRWDFGVGYRYNRTRLSISEVDNDVESHELFLAFGRSF